MSGNRIPVACDDGAAAGQFQHAHFKVEDAEIAFVDKPCRFRKIEREVTGKTGFRRSGGRIEAANLVQVAKGMVIELEPGDGNRRVDPGRDAVTRGRDAGLARRNSGLGLVYLELRLAQLRLGLLGHHGT